MATSPGHPGPPGAGGPGGALPWSLLRQCPAATPWFQTSALQNQERTHFCGCKPCPTMPLPTGGTPGHECTGQPGKCACPSLWALTWCQVLPGVDAMTRRSPSALGGLTFQHCDTKPPPPPTHRCCLLTASTLLEHREAWAVSRAQLSRGSSHLRGISSSCCLNSES